jgi:hypothetical protein
MGNMLAGHTTDMATAGTTSRTITKSNLKVGAIPSVVAVDGFVLPWGYDVVEVTGNTNFSNINATNVSNYSMMLRFTGTPTVFDGAGNISLAGNFVATANSTLTLVNTGSGWTEVSRAIV